MAPKLVTIDLRKQFKFLYSPSAKEVQVVDVPKFNMIMVDGKGDPNSASFHDAIQTMYTVSFTVKFDLKKSKRLDYPVMPLEGLWWIPGSAEFDTEKRKDWRWTLMIMQPDFVGPEEVKAAAEAAKRKGKRLEKFRLEDFHEGLSAQILHVGPYSAELPTIRRLRDFATENGYEQNGKHHEIYMGDPRRAAPSKLKTILRQPIRKAGRTM